MEHIYEDVEYLVGFKGVMTHQLPNAWRAMQAWLKSRVLDTRFWDDQFDTTHQGEVEIQPMTKEEQDQFWKRYGALPSPLDAIGKDKIIAIQL